MDFIRSLAHIPSPSSNRIAIRVSREAERKILQGHPWLYENSILDQSFDGNSGDLAVVFDRNRKFVAIGIFDPFSTIRVRILQHRTPTPIGKTFFKKRFQAAKKIREGLPPDTTGYRLINGENDGFPGLVIDRYNQILVAKIYTLSLLPYLKDILTCLQENTVFDTIILRLSRRVTINHQFLYGLRDGDFLFGSPQTPNALFRENKLWFEADPILGHKTGFYFDQRENRIRVEKLVEGKSVLNLFAYSGGFSVYAARGGANHVTSVDMSKPALEVANRNFRRNQDNPAVSKCIHSTILGDVFQILTQLGNENQLFDTVIVDPPSFAKKINEVEKAVAAYQRLTRLALKVLTPGGMLVQASCSSKVSQEMFFNAVTQAAVSIGRPFHDVEKTGHPIDHPIRFKEGAYLKCIFAKC